MKKRLTKSQNKCLSGVISGICEYFNLDENWVIIIRITYVILATSTMGSLIFIYIILHFILPEANSNISSSQPKTNKKIKEAEKVEESEDDWSDF
ncbi:MAG: PspC domain-containing protein [Lactovum sp.]